MMAKKPLGIILYGFWGIFVGLFYIAFPLFVPKFLNISFSIDKFIRGSFWGILYILSSVLLMTKFKFGKLKQNGKRLFFLFMNIVTAYLQLQAALHYQWQIVKGELLAYAFIFVFIVVPLSSIIYFNIPLVRNYFKGSSE